jgi:hypothetical protein
VCRALRAKAVSGKAVSLIKVAYNNFSCRFIRQGIQVKSGVRQGCLLSPIIFLSAMDEVMRKVIENYRKGTT